MSDERWRPLRNVFRRDARAEVDDELRFHLEMRTRELMEQGMSAEQARAAARERFGSIPPIESALVNSTHRRRQRNQRAESFADLAHDIRYAFRTLLHSPTFAIVASLTIALGVGATTSIFSIVHGVMFRPLPFTGAERIVVPQSVRLGADEKWTVTYRDFLAWQQDSVFDAAALFHDVELDITGDCTGTGCDPERVSIAIVTQDFFKVLGVRPLLGRFPQPDEFKAGTPRPIVLSYGLWQRRYAGKPSAVGSAIRMTGVPVTIVGVLPRGAEWPRNAGAWYPDRSTPDESTMAPDNFIFQGVARLRPGQSMDGTRARLATMAASVAQQFPAKRKAVSVTVTPLQEYVVGPVTARALWVLLGAVAVVLLIACVNVANLMLARATSRERELSLRTALGAGRWRLVRQLLTESLVLALIGGLLALPIAAVTSRALISMAPVDVLRAAPVRLDLATLGAAALATLLAAVLFGIAPALRASSTRPAQAMGEGTGRTVGGRRARRASAVLVVAEVALSLTLLSGAGLLVKSLMRLRSVDTGLDVRRTLTFQVALPQSRFETRAAIAGFWDEYLRRLRGIPGVTAASVATALPLGGGGFYLGRTMIQFGAPEPPGGTEIAIMWNEVETDYFRAVGQPLLAGREFTERDDTTAAKPIIVTKAFAEEMYPGRPFREAVGKHVFSWRDERVEREIAGIVGDIRYDGASDRLRPIVYVPLRQSPRSSSAVIVRSNASAAELARQARRELVALDAGIAMAHLKTMEEVLAESIAPQRFNAILFASFAVLAVVLAAIGLYGVLAYGVARETREIGVRMALGDTPAGVKRRVIGRSLTLAGAGAVIGLAGSLVVTRALGSLLFDVPPGDPFTLGAVTVLLMAVAALAGWIPARRATLVDPAIALRSE